jgi:hypothetical protein
MNQKQKFKKQKDREKRVRKKILARRENLRKDAAAAKHISKLEKLASKGDEKALAELEAIKTMRRMMEEGNKKDGIFETAAAGFAPAPQEVSPKLQVVLDKLEERKKAVSGPSWD